ncbi:MAG: hypothetical protein M0R38_02765 [Bacteroidia bacterium]|nr:hypothetical protein [Bacteroidia bacterium]
MKRKITSILTLILIGSLAFSGCKKSNKDDDQKETNPCGDKNTCFKIGADLSYAFNTTWISQAQDKYKIYYNQSLGGTSSERLDLVIKSEGGLKEGTYEFISIDKPLNTNKQATFEYYKNNAGDLTQVKCESGTLTITKFADKKLSGKFTCAAKDAFGIALSVTSGNFYMLEN